MDDGLPTEKSLMRSRITWSIVATGILLMAIGLMHFSLTALREPGPLETHLANLAKRAVIRLATFWCKSELREANPAHSQAGGQPLNAGFCALPLIRQTRLNDARNSYGLRCQVPANVD